MKAIAKPTSIKPQRDVARFASAIAAGIAGVALIGFLDWNTGVEISFSIFYLLPIVASIWMSGRLAGLTISLVAAVVWVSLDLAGGSIYSHYWIPVWNGIVRLGFFVLTTMLLSRVRNFTSELQQRVQERTAELEAEVRQRVIFATLSQQLGAANEEREAGEIIFRIASELFGWDAAYLHLYSPADDRIVPVLTLDTVNNQRTEIPPETFTLDPSPLMRRIMMQGAEQVNRLMANSFLTDLVAFGDSQRRSAAMMYVPIRSGGVTQGVLSIQSYTSGVYDKKDLALLQTLADHCGDALLRIKLSGDIAEVSQREQQKIAHDLHDHLGAFLAGAAFRIKALAQQLDRRAVPEAAEAAALVGVVNNSIDQVRNFARLLSPSDIVSGGLEPTLRRLCGEVHTLFGVECHFESTGELPTLGETQMIHLYRIAQEAARNAVQHGRAQHIQISLKSDPATLTMNIGNDGAVWDPQNVFENKLGLRIMRYRAGRLGGSLELQPQPDGRIAVVFHVPLSALETTTHLP